MYTTCICNSDECYTNFTTQRQTDWYQNKFYDNEDKYN